jgi:hypothetical protein
MLDDQDIYINQINPLAVAEERTEDCILLTFSFPPAPV